MLRVFSWEIFSKFVNFGSNSRLCKAHRKALFQRKTTAAIKIREISIMIFVHGFLSYTRFLIAVGAFIFDDQTESKRILSLKDTKFRSHFIPGQRINNHETVSN